MNITIVDTFYWVKFGNCSALLFNLNALSLDLSGHTKSSKITCYLNHPVFYDEHTKAHKPNEMATTFVMIGKRALPDKIMLNITNYFN